MPFQAKLVTKLEQFSVGDTAIELNNNVDKDELNNIVKTLIKQLDNKEDSDYSKLENIFFDFIVCGKFLHLSVEKHLEAYADEIDTQEVLNEKQIDIEYVLALESPKPLDAVPHDDWVSCVDANPTHIVTGSYDNSIRIFSVLDRKNLVTLKDAHSKPLADVRWVKNPNAKNGTKGSFSELFFVSCGHDEVCLLWRFSPKRNICEVILKFQGHNRSVNCVDSLDDLIATGSYDKSLRLWSTNISDDVDETDEEDSSTTARQTRSNKKTKTKANESASTSKQTKKAIMTLTGHQESITGVRWITSPSEFNSLATCSLDGSIFIWDIEVGECKRKAISAKPLLGIDYSAENNLLVSASCDKFIRLWDARGPDNASAKTAYTSHSAWVSSVAFCKTSSNNFISGGYDNLVKLWDIRSTKACLYDLIGHHDKVLDVNCNNPSYVFSGSADSTLKVFATK